MAYTTVAKVKSSLGSQNWNSNDISDADLTIMITDANSLINFELELDSDTTYYATYLGKLECDLVIRGIKRSKEFKSNRGPLDLEGRSMKLTDVDFTPTELDRLTRIKKKVLKKTDGDDTHAMVFNINTGDKLTI
jgi:hypothetical protein